MSKGPTARTIARRLAAERKRDAETIAQLLERPSPMLELGAAAAAYLHEFGSDGYTLRDFLDFVRAQTTPLELRRAAAVRK
jgi:hypothetical protein